MCSIFWGDNGSVTITRAEAQDTAFAEAVEKVVATLGPNVVRVRYNFEPDSTGDPAVFFRVLLTDEAAKRERLLSVIKEIERAIVWGVEPLEQWGVLPYFDYRSETEQNRMKTSIWT